MFEIILVCIIALSTIYLIIDTKIKLKKHDRICNIVLESAKLNSENISIDDEIKSLKDSNTIIVYNCMKNI